MRRPRTPDDIEQLYARARTPEEHRTAAHQLAKWAEKGPAEEGPLSPAALLVSAGEQLTEAGDLPGALDHFRRAVDAGHYMPPTSAATCTAVC